MNIVCVYDFQDSANGIKAMKLLRRYLFHLQKSVFYGTLTPVKFKELQIQIKPLVSHDDQVIFYFTYKDQDLKQKTIGKPFDLQTVI